MTRDFWWIVIYGPMTQRRILRALRFAGARAEPRREVVALGGYFADPYASRPWYR